MPSGIGTDSWFGWSENGPLATTVEDATTMLSVLAERRVAGTGDAGPWRVALAVRAPLPGTPIAPAWAAAAERAAVLLAEAGHRVRRAEPPAPLVDGLPIFLAWMAATAHDADAVVAAGGSAARFEPRTRRHASVGRLAERLGLVRTADHDAWRARQARWFAAGHDLLVTPTLAHAPLPADGWPRRGWLATALVAARFAPLTGAWNVAGFPAASVPMGTDGDGLPVAVQLVAPPGGEGRVLAAARLLERVAPWARHAPMAAG